MCCLKYEQDAYEDAVKRCPKQDSFVECPDGVGNITSVNLLKEQVKVKLEDSTEQPKNYRVEEIRVVRSGKGKRPEDYVAPSQSELEKLRYVDPDEGKTRKFGDIDDLSARLAQYLGDEEQGQEEEKKSSARRRHRGGRGKGKPAEKAEQPQQPAEKTQVKEKSQTKEKTQEAKQQGQKKPAKQQVQKQPPKQQPAAEKQQDGSGEKKNRSRYRPRHRKPKAQGGGEKA
jgi:hypothetical protein